MTPIKFKKGNEVFYRGAKYKVKGIKNMYINNKQVIMLNLAHKKYNLWVNVGYVIKC